MGNKGEEGGEGTSCEKWRGEVLSNWTRISDSQLCEKAESGDVLTVWVNSRSTGRVITVKKVRIEALLEKIVESEVTRARSFSSDTLPDFRTTSGISTHWIRKV